ncbi:MAG: redox-regulated ATPase YchF [Rickettsiales bacterium]|jgi:GTP-binding protein YchF|nr:redox-regulated ATPase YchF [Rickettsiales bacterium]
MVLQCGIVGLPNVGKSTLFNALTQTMLAEAANYPFCTISANVGRVSVPDERLEKLAKIAKSQEVVKTQIDFVDIAGLVRGASRGEGLGNQFLSNIREVDCILNVVCCFDDENVTHVEGDVNPTRDIELIQTELILADIESLEKRLQNAEKKIKSGDKSTIIQMELMKRVLETLNGGKMAVVTNITKDEEKAFKMLQLLTGKKQFFVCNVGENEVNDGNTYTREVEEYRRKNGYIRTIIKAKDESEIAMLDTEVEKLEFLKTLGLGEKGLDKIIKIAYSLLNLISFFTVGPKEAHSWTVVAGSYAPQAAGTIHTDFEKGFIRAETISYADYLQYNGEEGCRSAGKLRLEGKDYIVSDGDIFHFRFNV